VQKGWFGGGGERRSIVKPGAGMSETKEETNISGNSASLFWPLGDAAIVDKEVGGTEEVAKRAVRAALRKYKKRKNEIMKGWGGNSFRIGEGGKSKPFQVQHWNPEKWKPVFQERVGGVS